MIQIEAEDFKIRCSAVGQIMADKKKDGSLPKGAITYLHNWHYERSTGEVLFQGNKYTKKGWEVEGAAIDDYIYQSGEFGLDKNERFFYNDWTEGTPDVLEGGDIVVDIKAPWSIDTFKKYTDHTPTEKYPAPNSNYFWQLQAYCWVTGREYCKLVYVLKNTPLHLLSQFDVFEDYESEISLEKRVKVFGFPRSNAHISRIKQRVEECREYLRQEIIPKANY